MADAPKKPYGDVPYADPGYQDDKKKRYPAAKKFGVEIAEEQKGSLMDLSKRAELLHGVREVRDWTMDGFELRDTGHLLTLTGEASIVDHPYEVTDRYGKFTETVHEGAFDKTLSENADVVLLVNHEGLPLARTSSGTLDLTATPHLGVEARLEPSDPDVQRIAMKIERGDLREMSFAFRVTQQSWNEEYTDRQITEVNLQRGDVSVVTYGANPATHASLRGEQEFQAFRRELISAPMLTDASALCAQLDAALDEALLAVQGGDSEAVLAILTNADLISDAMMQAMGLSDPDEQTSAPDPDEMRYLLARRLALLDRRDADALLSR